MGKQRPYEDFETAYILFLLKKCPDDVDKLLEQMHSFYDHGDDMRLPYTLLRNSDISRFWWCLCRMYGEVNTSIGMEYSVLDDYISNAELGVCLKALEHQIEYVRLAEDI